MSAVNLKSRELEKIEVIGIESDDGQLKNGKSKSGGKVDCRGEDFEQMKESKKKKPMTADNVKPINVPNRRRSGDCIKTIEEEGPSDENEMNTAFYCKIDSSSSAQSTSSEQAADDTELVLQVSKVLDNEMKMRNLSAEKISAKLNILSDVLQLLNGRTEQHVSGMENKEEEIEFTKTEIQRLRSEIEKIETSKRLNDEAIENLKITSRAIGLLERKINSLLEQKLVLLKDMLAQEELGKDLEIQIMNLEEANDILEKKNQCLKERSQRLDQTNKAMEEKSKHLEQRQRHYEETIQNLLKSIIHAQEDVTKLKAEIGTWGKSFRKFGDELSEAAQILDAHKQTLERISRTVARRERKFKCIDRILSCCCCLAYPVECCQSDSDDMK